MVYICTYACGAFTLELHDIVVSLQRLTAKFLSKLEEAPIEMASEGENLTAQAAGKKRK